MAIPETFAALCRERSGMSLGDSGAVYGYQWQKPPVPADMPLEYASGRSYPMILISLSTVLDQYFEIDVRRTKHFRRWAEIVSPIGSYPQRTWFDLAREYVTRMSDKGKAGEGAEGLINWNAYNGDNDFDQNFEITSPGLYADWHVLHVHTGCDVRGGYADPVIMRGVSGYGDGYLDDLMCNDQISLWCSRCDVSADNLYRAEENGWKFRVQRRTVAAICPKCHRNAVTFPIDPAFLAAESAEKAS